MHHSRLYTSSILLGIICLSGDGGPKKRLWYEPVFTHQHSPRSDVELIPTFPKVIVVHDCLVPHLCTCNLLDDSSFRSINLDTEVKHYA